jgi:hypothetical protein
MVLHEMMLKDAMKRVSDFMDGLSTTHDSPMVLLNGFSKWCVKFDTHNGDKYYAFGTTLSEALNNLVDAPIIYGRSV